MRPKSASNFPLQPYTPQRVLLLALALLLVPGTVALNSNQVVSAQQQKSSGQESDPSADSSEKKKAQPKPTDGDESPNERSSSQKKSAPNKDTSQSMEQNKADQEKTGAEQMKSSVAKTDREVENEAAKAEEEAGAEVEILDDSEEEDPKESAEETPPVAQEPAKEVPKEEKRVIGATAVLMEKKSELLFRARVDTGAKSCSLHIEDMKIENESENMADNIGKVVSFKLKNGKDESHWLKAKIAGYVIIKTSNEAADRKRRYKVPLTFRYKDFEKTVLVTLNNREHMDFPLLLGRNFLKGDFVVDVDIDSAD